ncbi:hypothetical protein RISK_000860 [Rhodopirellula islandica]|uniref:Uncharacterized protein n=1 Tax=Rhodopirellula islandica TaxID=595434 RepID=A0A0J1ENG8_RHOIS|nr:hypothetical protein RISK_000860 [Rhodopirellula islandica]
MRGHRFSSSSEFNAVDQGGLTMRPHFSPPRSSPKEDRAPLSHDLG